MSVELVVQDSVAEIVLNRPQKMNALNEAAMQTLAERLDAAEKAGVRALILRGEGPGFSAGRDLSDADPFNEDGEAILNKMVNPVIQRVADFPAPTFAAVHGPCLGIGLGLALACDVVYAADDAKIGSPFARIGAVLDSGAHLFFVRRLGGHRALELIYTGTLISGREAETWGLINHSVDKSILLERVREVAAAVAQGPTSAFLESKRLVRRIENEGLGLAEVLRSEAKAQGAASRTADYREGISAFQSKRSPRFVGR
jgi:enoyl-CoA hydratase/carnithine racemase